MRSSIPKVLHPVCGRPMIAWPVNAAREAGAGRVAVIVSPDRDISAALPPGTETVVQPQADGTGGALRAALELIDASETVVVLSGDHPLISAQVIARLLATHEESGAAATLVSTIMDAPGSYGRIVRDRHGDVERIVEAKAPGDATREELEIEEVNAGTYAFDGPALADALVRISNDNAQGEYYLGDVLPIMRDNGWIVAAHRERDYAVNLGVNDRIDLARATKEAQRRILHRHMAAGVTILDPLSTWIDADVEIGRDVLIEPGTRLRGGTSIGDGSIIGPMTTITDSGVGERVTIPHSYLLACVVADDATVGPFAYLRPGTSLAEDSKAGAFVEIKNSQIGAGAKVPHLSYIGDTEVGEHTNLGASTITANYDGFRKNRTKIGKRVHTGVDTTFVAPVEVGDDAYTGAGSVIVENVPPGALGISRAGQTNVEGYAERKAAEQSAQKKRTQPARRRGKRAAQPVRKKGKRS